MPGRIFVAIESFSTAWEGRPLLVQGGATVREGHPLLSAYPGLFKVLVPTFEHTTPPAKPAQAAKPPTQAARVTPRSVVAGVKPEGNKE